MVSTSRNKICKIFSCLDEIVFFYSRLFARGNKYRNVEANFWRKSFLLVVETVFLASEKQFFQSITYSIFFPSSRNVFLTNSSFRLVDTHFLSSGKSIIFQSFVEAFEIQRLQFLLVETDFRNHFFLFCTYSF